MNLNRRKMFTAAVGGALAGPDMAKSAIAAGVNAARMLPPSALPGYPGKAVAQSAISLQQIARIKRMASGDVREEDRDYDYHPAEGPPQPFRALKSVSEEARQFMRNSYYERKWKERMIKNALDAIDHYDKTGILRNFF